jgi:hypothetical protein
MPITHYHTLIAIIILLLQGCFFKFRFVHLTELITPVSCEEAVNLAIAADQFIIDSLREYSISLIREKINPSNIWTSLDTLLAHNLEDVAEACSWVISYVHTLPICFQPFYTFVLFYVNLYYIFFSISKIVNEIFILPLLAIEFLIFLILLFWCQIRINLFVRFFKPGQSSAWRLRVLCMPLLQVSFFY